MKILVPDFMHTYLATEACARFAACDFITITRKGEASAPYDEAEIVMLPWGLPEEVQTRILALPRLRWVQTISAGISPAVLEALRARPEVILTNATGVFDIPIAETVLTYILMIVKRMPEFMAQQREHRWHKLPLRELRGLTVGIIGLGGIGREVARRCQALGMRVIATRRHPEQGAPYVEALFPPARLDELLAQSDFVVLSVPLTPETHHLIHAERLQVMRPDAWLINIARGAVVDEAALIAALREKRIGGAALDVTESEPLPADSPLWELPNVMLTPHNSWSTPYLEERQKDLFLDNLARYLNGEALRNVVDKALGY